MTVEIRGGDCRELLKAMPDGSVHCVVSSPPYWGLRDYGVDGQVGMEPTPEEYVAEMVAIFREVRRVLRDDGTVWLNIGDSYNAYNGNAGLGSKLSATQSRERPVLKTGHGLSDKNLKPKDLIGIPWMVAFGLRADGWWLRQDNIWAKRNCMPESIRDRTTRAHEYVFQLTKSGSPTYWTHRDLPGVRARPDPDHRWIDAIDRSEHAIEPPPGWQDAMLPGGKKKRWRRVNLWEGQDYFYDAVAIEEDGVIAAGTRAAKGSDVRSQIKEVNGRPPEYFEYTGKRNKRSVWWVATQPFAEAHFATMPPDLAETCIMAGTSERGCCAGCGAPWTRATAERARAEGRVSGNLERTPGTDRIAGASHVGRGFPWEASVAVTTGWRPSCSCPPDDPVPCTVLDPFGGAGTTGLVADRLGRSAILIELNPEYCAIAERRLTGDSPLFAEVLSS